MRRKWHGFWEIYELEIELLQLGNVLRECLENKSKKEVSSNGEKKVKWKKPQTALTAVEQADCSSPHTLHRKVLRMLGHMPEEIQNTWKRITS